MLEAKTQMLQNFFMNIIVNLVHLDVAFGVRPLEVWRRNEGFLLFFSFRFLFLRSLFLRSFFSLEPSSSSSSSSEEDVSESSPSSSDPLSSFLTLS